ncbi:MAG: hypothetical protein WDN00_17615 [Limisphaerales bacterium]
MDSKLELPLPYFLLTESESTEIWNRPDKESLRGRRMDGWKIFRERYPGAGGHISFPESVSTSTRNRHSWKWGIQADWLMGHGEVILLSLEETGWKVSSELHLWIS